MKKKIGMIAAGVLVIIICIGAWNLFGNKTTSTDSIYLDTAELKGNTFTTKGGFAGGAMKYRGYEYKIDEKNMYVYVKNGLFFGGTGAFTIKIEDDKLKNIDNIYLQGKNKSDSYLMWPDQEE